jgi:hypothetical protein
MIVHRGVFILKRNVSETRVCLRLQVKPTEITLIYWDGPNKIELVVSGHQQQDQLGMQNNTTQTTNESQHFHTLNLHTRGA